jgi:GNAT superfamily N-acetyltransferase
MIVTIAQERADSADAVALISELDDLLTPLYPSESRHGYSVTKLIDQGVHFFVVRADDTPAACGGVQLFGQEYGELKRMYVRPTFRGHGFGKLLVEHLTEFVRRQGVHVLRLETGIHQTKAIGLYERLGFRQIAPFGAYKADPLSLFYERIDNPGNRLYTLLCGTV